MSHAAGAITVQAVLGLNRDAPRNAQRPRVVSHGAAWLCLQSGAAPPPTPSELTRWRGSSWPRSNSARNVAANSLGPRLQGHAAERLHRPSVVDLRRICAASFDGEER